jgi:hypothetical protein
MKTRKTEAILAAKCLIEQRCKNHDDRWGRSGEPHSFLAEEVQSGPQPSRVRPEARAERPLTARTALRKFPQEGMAPCLLLTMSDLYHSWEGK